MEESINLQDILIEAIDNVSLKESMEMGQIEVDLEPVSLRGNRDLLIRMIENLLRNAYESHSTNTVDIKILGELKNDLYIFSVRDSGIGIQDSEEIFKPFFTTKNYGTGLGLQVVKDAVIRHSAELMVQKNLEGGTTFIVKFMVH